MQDEYTISVAPSRERRTRAMSNLKPTFKFGSEEYDKAISNNANSSKFNDRKRMKRCYTIDITTIKEEDLSIQRNRSNG